MKTIACILENVSVSQWLTLVGQMLLFVFFFTAICSRNNVLDKGANYFYYIDQSEIQHIIVSSMSMKKEQKPNLTLRPHRKEEAREAEY